MAKIIYGGGLRLQECLRLRIKDVDFENDTIWVHTCKGDKDQKTILAQSVKEEFEFHLQNVKKIMNRIEKRIYPVWNYPTPSRKNIRTQD